MASSIVAIELNNYCNLLVIASNVIPIVVGEFNTVRLTDESILGAKLQELLEAYR